MIFSQDAWKQYFFDPHEGLGTTYERFILHRRFEQLYSRYSVGSVLEVPSFGMTGVSGINSMWWSRRGAFVTVVDDNRERIGFIKKVWNETGLNAQFVYQDTFANLPFSDNEFDMGWNFAALRPVRDISGFFAELTRVTRKVVFICVPNRGGLGYMCRFGLRSSSGSGYDTENNSPVRIADTMTGLGWHCAESGYLDVPPWPDIAMKKEDFLNRIGLGRLVPAGMRSPDSCMCILDYFRGIKKDMEQEIMKYSFLEHSPTVIKRFWAHHRYFIFVPHAV